MRHPFPHLVIFLARQNPWWWQVATLGTLAHNLAQYARHVRGFSVWTENIPSHLSHILFADHG